jgi:hypothetical protein
MSNWISVNESLPEIGQVVALAHNDRWMNTGDMHDPHGCNWYGAGYLAEFGNKYWNVFGETRSQCLDSVTHWMQMDQVPQL